MKHLKLFALLLLATIFMVASCKKTTDPSPDDFYFRCKINGQLYIPNSCANCLTCTVYKDTILLLGANQGYKVLTIGINDNLNIRVTTYILNEIIGRQGTYKNSTLTNDRYFTDAKHTGQLQITTLDKTNKILQGTFYFKAFNSYSNDSISVTDGDFRLHYTIN